MVRIGVYFRPNDGVYLYGVSENSIQRLDGWSNVQGYP